MLPRRFASRYAPGRMKGLFGQAIMLLVVVELWGERVLTPPVILCQHGRCVEGL